MFISLLLLVSCANYSDQRSKENNKEINRYNASSQSGKDKTSDEKSFGMAFEPLTYEKYLNLKNNIDQFSCINIFYTKTIDQDSEPPPQYFIIFDLDAGSSRKGRYLSSITEYKGEYQLQDYDIHKHEMKQRGFSPEDVEMIFDYLETNNEYFFNAENDEFNGLDIPYVTDSRCMNPKNYCFTLAFYDPNDTSLKHDRAWVISESANEPTEIFQGLINLLENNLISQFE